MTRRWAAGAVAGLLVVTYVTPSLWVGLRFAGTPGLVVVALVSTTVCGLAYAASRHWVTTRTRQRWTAGAFVAVASTAFLVVYPWADARKLQGLGSDRDDAIQTAVNLILRGGYPYAEPTYLGHPVTPLPGSFLLHAPVTLLHLGTAYAEPLLLALAVVLVSRAWGGDGAVLVLSLGGAAFFWEDFLNGGDYVTTAVLAFAASTFSLRALLDGRRSSIVWGILLGVVCTTRPTMLVFILAVALVARPAVGLTSTLRWSLIPLATVVVLVLPVWALDPEGFTPLHVAAKAGSPVSGVGGVVLAVAWVAVSSTRVGPWPSLPGRLAFVLAPTGLLVSIPPALARPDTLEVLGFASVTAFLAPVAIVGARTAWRSGPTPAGDPAT